MSSQLKELKEKIESGIEKAADLETLDEIRVKALGKNGEVTGLLKTISSLPPEERKDFGQAVNDLKGELSDLITKRIDDLKAARLKQRLENETVDITLPVRENREGRVHPITQITDDIVSIFAELGFTVATGPSLEDDFHNFTALNFPHNHPARQMHDTFYIEPEKEGAEKKVLRTHTSTVQVRVMQNSKPPIRVIVPGRTYRSDYDQTHTPMFHQVEGLVIDESTNMAHLKGTLETFCREIFEIDELKMRFRPYYFPFTEPSAEVDIGCSKENGELKIGEGDDWMEIMGCGMVHPNVIKNCGLDPDKYQGYAFGMGIERIAMLKYGIPDLRTFFESDLRWLRHYGFSTLEQINRGL